VYAIENCEPLKGIENEYTDFEVEKTTGFLSSNPSENQLLRNVIEVGQVEANVLPQNKSETDSIVVITQTRTVTLRNPSQQELQYWLREYKKWI
jgi:hypothetical protein